MNEEDVRYAEIAELMDEMHPSMCRCEGRCHGWWDDYVDMVSYLRDRFGTAMVLDGTLTERKSRARDEEKDA